MVKKPKTTAKPKKKEKAPKIEAVNTTIMISKDNHEKILRLKSKDRLASVNDVITDLLKDIKI